MKKNKILNIILITSALILTGVLGWLLFCNNTTSKIEPIVKEEPINKEGVDEIFDIASAENTHLNPVLEVDDVKYLENGDIDKSKWIKVKNSKYGIILKVPPFILINGSDFGRNFSLKMIKDENWYYDYQFGPVYEDNRKLPLEEKARGFSSWKDNSGYFELKKEGVIIVYSNNPNAGLYSTIADAVIMTENEYIGCGNFMINKKLNNTDIEKKYYDVLVEILKTIELS